MLSGRILHPRGPHSRGGRKDIMDFKENALGIPAIFLTATTIKARLIRAEKKAVDIQFFQRKDCNFVA